MTKISDDQLTVDQPQIWAEAVALYKAGEKHWLTDDEEVMARLVQEDRQEDDPWYAKLDQEVGSMPRLRVKEILENIINVPAKEQRSDHQKRVEGWLSLRGYRRVKAERGQGWVFER